MKQSPISFHDFTLCMGIIVGMLGSILMLLFLLKPEDSLLNDRRLLLIFCAVVLTLSMTLFLFIFSSVRRHLHKDTVKHLRDLLSARGYASHTPTKDAELWRPETNHFFRLQSESICLFYHQNGEIVAQFPRYLLLTFPKRFWLTPIPKA
jgi:hypothetical protein